ncbi:MAG: hypothetical protein ACO3ZY_06465 [Phycisphaerales bacterium]
MIDTASDPLLTDDSYEALLQDVGKLAEAVRSSLRRCFETALLPGTGARGCGRALGLRRNLAWKAYAVANSADLPSLLRALPGDNGWALVFEALEQTGRCEAEAIATLRTAVSALATRISEERLDPAALRAIGSGSLESAAERRAMLRSRRSAFTASKQIYGVHAKARIGAFLVAPSTEPGESMVDLAALTIFEGLDRTRPGPPFPFYHRIRTHQAEVSGTRLGGDLMPGDLAPMVPALSSEAIVPEEVRVGPSSKGGQPEHFEFVRRSRRRLGPLRVAFAECSRRVASPFVHGSDTHAELRMPTAMPVEAVVFDVLIHRDLPLGSEPAASLYGHAADHSRATAWHENHRLPLEGDCSETGSLRLPQALVDVRAPYDALLKLGAETIGAPLSKFRAYRVVVPWPPMHSSLLITWRLAER